MKKLIATTLMIITLAAMLMLTSCEAGKAISAAGQIAGVVKPLIEKHEHVIGAMPDVESTCMEPGLTGGLICLSCGEVLVEPVKAPLAPHRYDGDDDSTCNWCNYERFCLHRNTQKIVGKIATCKEKGLTDGEICLDCNATITPQYEIPLATHTETTLPSTAPTCTSIGLTEGKHCSVCKTVIVAQNVIPATGHTFGNWVTVKNPTTTEEGIKERYCTTCGAKEIESISMIKGSEGLKFKSNGDGTCYVSGIGTCTDTDIVIPRFSPDGDRVTSIGEYAFYNCSSLTSVVIPDNVTNINNRAFYGCASLTSVVIPDSVTSIGFCAFSICSSLTNIVIPDSVTSIGSGAFFDCYKLVEVINKSSLDITAGSSDYGDVAYYAIEVHSGDSKIVNKDDYLFYTYGGVNYLVGYVGNDTELTLPSSYNGESYEIYMYAFVCCDSLTSIVIPDSVTSIGEFAFGICSSLTSVVIGNNVTSIGDWTFSECSSLTSVVIGDSVTSIGLRAFYYCTNLKDVYYTGTESEWAEIIINSDGNDDLKNATIHYNYVPAN